MDPKKIRNSVSASVNDDSTKYVHSSPSLPANKNKSYHDIGSRSEGKVEATTARPCAIIGPDRVLPHTPGDVYLKKTPADTWPYPDNAYHRLPDYPQKISDYQPNRNISPRQTFQENMQRIMVPPLYSSVKNSDEFGLKNTKLGLSQEAKYCDVPYNTSSTAVDHKSVRNSDISLSNVNPAVSQSVPYGWASGVNIHPPRHYVAPEFYQCPEYTSYPTPRQMAIGRAHRSHQEDTAQAYSERLYQEANIRFKPYPMIPKEKHQQARYDYINNYPNTFHPPVAFPTHKYELQKPLQGHPYPVYPQVKYMERRIHEPFVDPSYQRPNQPNLNLPFHNQALPPPYGPVPGNCIQNKTYSDISSKPMTVNKLHLESNNKMYVDSETARSKGYPMPDNIYYNDMNHIRGVVLPPNHSMINMHSIPQHQIYRRDNTQPKPYEYNIHYRNLDPSVNPNYSLSRLPLQFSPNAIAISPSDSNTSNDTTHTVGQNSQEDCGYVSQSSTASVRSIDTSNILASNDFYRTREYTNFGIIRKPIRTNEHTLQSHKTKTSSSSKKNIDVRQFLQMWNEDEDETNETNKEVSQIQSNNLPISSKNINNQEQLYVLGSVTVPTEDLSKYEHIQKVSKLPENIIGYNSNELLNQYEKLLESPNTHNNFISKVTLSKNNNSHTKKLEKQTVSLPRPLTPLDVEAKISQSVIHKEVGCNFEIKPCSPVMLNVEVATPVQHVLEERIIEKFANPMIPKSPMNNIGKITNCNLINTQYPLNSYPNLIKPNNNYGVQEFNTNSGISLASLPRLDNDIELNFPEINQQFINANKIESEKKSTKELPHFNLEQGNQNQEKKSNHQYNLLSSQVSPVSVEKEISKLSKYRKNKKCDLTYDKPSPTVPIQRRVDSVIIKNPDNSKLAEDINEVSGSVSDIVEENLNYRQDNRLDSQKSPHSTNDKNNEIYDFSFETAIDFSLNKTDRNDNFNDRHVHNNKSNNIVTGNDNLCNYYDNTEGKVSTEIQLKGTDEHKLNGNASVDIGSSEVNKSIAIPNASNLPLELNRECNVPDIKESELVGLKIEEDLDFKKENDTSVIKNNKMLSFEVTKKGKPIQNIRDEIVTSLDTVVNAKTSFSESVNTLDESNMVLQSHFNKKIPEYEHNKVHDGNFSNFEEINNVCDDGNDLVVKNLEFCRTTKSKEVEYSSRIKNDTYNSTKLDINVSKISEQPDCTYSNNHIAGFISEEQNFASKIFSIEKEYNVEKIKRRKITDIHKLSGTLNDNHADFPASEPLFNRNSNDYKDNEISYENIDKLTIILDDKQVDVSKLKLADFIYNNDSKGNKNLIEKTNNSFSTSKHNHVDILESETLPLFSNNNSKNIVKLYDEIEKSSITDHLSIVEPEPPLVTNNTDNDCEVNSNKPNEQVDESFITLNDKHEKITEFQLQLVIQSDSTFNDAQNNISESKSPDLFNNNEYSMCESVKLSATLNNKHSISSKLRTSDNDCKNKETQYVETHISSITLNNDHELISESKFSLTRDHTEYKNSHKIKPINYCKCDEKPHEEVEKSCITLDDNHVHVSESQFIPFCDNNECHNKITSDNDCKEDHKLCEKIDKLPITLNDDQGLVCESEFRPLCENNECKSSDKITSEIDSKDDQKEYEEISKLPKRVSDNQGHIPQFAPVCDNNKCKDSDIIMHDNDSKGHEKPHENVDKSTITLHDDHGHISKFDFNDLRDSNNFKVIAKIMPDNERKGDQKTYGDTNKSITSNHDHGHNSEPELPDLSDNNECKVSHNTMPDNVCKEDKKPYDEIDKATFTLNDNHGQISITDFPASPDNNESKVSDKIGPDINCKDSENSYNDIEKILNTSNRDHGHISESEFPSLYDNNEFKDRHIIIPDKDFKGDGKTYQEIDKSTFSLNDDRGHISKYDFPALYDNNESKVSDKMILDNDFKGDEKPYEEIDKLSIILNEDHENISEFPTLCDNNESKVNDKIILDNDFKDDEHPYEEIDKISMTLNEDHEIISELPTLCDNNESKVGDNIILDNDCKDDQEPYEEIDKISMTLNEDQENISKFSTLWDNNESKVSNKIILDNDCKDDEEPYKKIDKISVTLNKGNENISEFPNLCDNNEYIVCDKIMTDNDCKGHQQTYEEIDNISATLNNDHEHISESEFPALLDYNEKPYKEMDKSSITINDFKKSLEPEIFCNNNISEGSEKCNINANLDNNISKSEPLEFFSYNNSEIYISEPQDESMFDVRNSKTEICTEMNVETTYTDYLKIQPKKFMTTIRSQVKVNSNIVLDSDHVPKVSEDDIEINTQTHIEKNLLLNTKVVNNPKLCITTIKRSTHVCKELFSPWIQKLIIYNEGYCKISKIGDLKDEVSDRSTKIWSSGNNLKDNCRIDKFLNSKDTNELDINYCDSNAYKEDNVQNDLCSNIDSSEYSENKDNNNKTEKLITSIDSDSYTFSRRKALKRSLSESALQDFKDNEDFNVLSSTKRRKENQDIIQSHIISEDVCSIIQSNRRNSISTFYNEDNLYIVIDNDLILTEEDEESDKIYYTEMLEENINQNDCVEENMESSTTSEIHSDKTIELCEYASTEFTISVEKAVEESWVEDVACIETVISEDVTGDLEYDLDLLKEHINSNEIVTEESLMASDSEHIDKVKNIYGTTMSDDNTRLLETLYRTPQMDVNRALVDIESHNTDDDTEQSDIGLLDRDCCSEKLDVDVPLYNTSEMLNEKENIEQSSEVNNAKSLENPYQNLNTNNEFNLFQSGASEEGKDDMALYVDWNNDNLTKKSNSSYCCSSSPEVSSTTSEDKNSILLKITNYNGSRISHVNKIHENSINRLSYKLTEKEDYYDSNFGSSRPLITKAAQKYIPPLKESIRDLKVKLPLPQHRLNSLKQLKMSKAEPKIDDILIFNDKASKQSLPKKIKPKFEDVLKSIDEIHFKKNKDKTKRTKSDIPKVIIKKNENGAHYASSKTVSNTEAYNPDLTGRKWQPWVFLEKNNFIDRMAIKNKMRAVYCHRKNTYVLADRFKKYKSIYNANFVISRPQHPSKGNLKYTIRLKNI